MHHIAKYIFSDLKLGMKVEYSHLLTLDDIQTFVKLTGDSHPLHTSIDYAVEHGFDSVIAHGLLLSSLCSKVVGLHIPGENAIIVSQEFKYRRPAYIGQKLVISGEISAMDERFKEIVVKVKMRTGSNASNLISSGLFKVRLRK